MNAAGAAAGHVGRLAGVAVPIVPIKHQYVVSDPLAGAGATARHADRARPRPHRLLPRRGRRRCSSAATSAPRRSAGPTTAPPLASPRALFEPDLDRVRRVVGERPPAGAGAARRRDRPGGARRRGVHARRRVPARRDRGARLLGGGRLLRARARRGRRRRQGDGRVDRRRPARVRRVHMDIRRFGAHAASRSWATDQGARRLLPLLRHRLPVRRSGRPARPLRRSADLAPAVRRWTRRSARRPAGSGSTGSARNAALGDAALRPRRLGRAASGRRRSRPSARATADGRRAVRPVVVRQARRARRRTRPRSCTGCAPATSTGRRGRSSTPSCSTSGPASRPT